MKKIMALAVVLALALILILSACRDPKGHFPRWEDAGEAPEAVDGISMEFASLEHVELEEETIKWFRYFEPYDDWSALRVTLRLERETPAPPSYSWHIDYFYEDAWHTVYRPRPKPMAAIMRMYAAGEHDYTYAVPTQVLEWPGEYRLCQEDVGACTITIR